MLKSLNTKAVGYSGILSFVVGLLCYGPFQSALTSAVSAPVAKWLGIAFIAAGFAAAYYGMPHSVGDQLPPAPEPPAPAAQKAA